MLIKLQFFKELFALGPAITVSERHKWRRWGIRVRDTQCEIQLCWSGWFRETETNRSYGWSSKRRNIYKSGIGKFNTIISIFPHICALIVRFCLISVVAYFWCNALFILVTWQLLCGLVFGHKFFRNFGDWALIHLYVFEAVCIYATTFLALWR